MSDPTQLIVSIQGKRGSGKSMLAERAIEPMLKAVGAKLLKKTDEKSGVFLTVELPFGLEMLRDGPLQMFTWDQADEMARAAVQKDRQARGASISFASAPKLTLLLQRRAVLEDFLIGGEGAGAAEAICQQALPPELRKALVPARVIAMLRQDARLQIEEIDLALERMGFDTSDRANLPAV